MAVDPTAAERAYGAIKRELLDGAFHLRERLDASALAQRLAMSTTPVREALVRLAGERLIANRPTRGFYAMLWSEAQLRALYGWRAALMDLSNAASAGRRLSAEALGLEYPARVAALFGLFGASAGDEVARASANADDRLFPARRAEAELWPDIELEWAALQETLAAASPKPRKRALSDYHKRRIDAAASIRDRAIVRASPVNGG